LPPEFIEELSTLQDQVPPLGEQQVVEVMEQELGVPWEDVFEHIESQPMAAGTIAQVHEAILSDGSRGGVTGQVPAGERDRLPDPLSDESDERREAAKQMLESYYRQILTDGFFHADPHPGNLMWWNDKIYFIDFGMVGEVGPELRELLILMLMAFWQEDVPFLSDVVLMIASADQKPDLDVGAFQAELGALLARYRHLALREIQLGPILQEITAIA